MSAEYLLDASALLAFLRREPGWEVVSPVLAQSAITSVNLCEVLTKAAQVGVPWEEAVRAIRLLDLEVIPFEEEDACGMRRFAPLAWTRGYSLGDRVCLGAGAKRQLTVLTAERKWSEVKGMTVKVIR